MNSFIAQSKQMPSIGLAAALLALGLLTACEPSKEKRAQFAEEKRVACLDKFCEGDVDPRNDYIKDELLKFNGQWYVGSKYYYSSGINGASFSWPSKKSREDVPKEERDGMSDVVIFLAGRARWPEPNAVEPWKGKGWEGRFEELQSKGYKIERTQVRPDLEIVKFTDSHGKPYDRIYYLASQQKKLRGEGRPGVSCDQSDQIRLTCTGGVFWQEDVYADFRFRGKHAQDWPEIYQEIARVLTLLKKV